MVNNSMSTHKGNNTGLDDLVNLVRVGYSTIIKFNFGKNMFYVI